MGLVQIWALVRRGWLIILSSLAIGLGLAFAYSLTQPVLYSATSSGYVVAGNSATVGDAFAGSTLAAEKAGTYIPLIDSRSVADRIAEDLGLDSTDQVVAHLKGTTKGVIFSITATAQSPELAASLADAAIRATSVEANALETLTVSGEATGQTVVRIVPVEAAEAPRQPVSPNYRRNLAMGAVLGLLLGFGLVVARQGFDRRIRRANEAEEVAEASSLGIVPASAALNGKNGLVSGTGAAAEALRQVRTNLRYVSVDDPAKSIVITSSNEGEGKSTLAAQLAGLLAHAGEPTVLIDADLRRPVQAKRLGLDGLVGLSQVLAGMIEVDEALLTTDHQNLALLPAGRIPPNPAELVGSNRMKSLIADLSQTHTVIIDAPPLLSVTDAALLATAADGAVVVVQSGKTTSEQLGVAAHKIRQVSGNLLGVVLNKVAKKDMGEATFGYGYGSYTSKYYRAESDEHPFSRRQKVDQSPRASRAADVPMIEVDADRRPPVA